MTAYYYELNGLGKSANALYAEARGRYPMSTAMRVVAEAFRCTQAAAAIALKLLHDGEWHHVGKYATPCNYYDTADWRLAGTLAHIDRCGGAARFEKRRARLRAERAAALPPRPPKPGRVVVQVRRRRHARRLAFEILGRPLVEKYPVGAVRMLHAFGYHDHDAAGLARAAAEAGWSDERIVIAFADGLYPEQIVRNVLRALQSWRCQRALGDDR